MNSGVDVVQFNIDGIEISANPGPNNLLAKGGESHDALTTLMTMMRRVSSRAAVPKPEETLAQYQAFMEGKPYISEGFVARIIDPNIAYTRPLWDRFQAQYAATHGRPYPGNVWMCFNDWNSATTYLTEETFRLLLTFAKDYYSTGRIPEYMEPYRVE